MKVILFLVISGISNGTDAPIKHQMEKEFSDADECVKTSIILRKVLRAEETCKSDKPMFMLIVKSVKRA